MKNAGQSDIKNEQASGEGLVQEQATRQFGA